VTVFIIIIEVEVVAGTLVIEILIVLAFNIHRGVASVDSAGTVPNITIAILLRHIIDIRLLLVEDWPPRTILRQVY
jgi:hypothetical protein